MKNEDNVFLTCVPEIYKLFFGSDCNDFTCVVKEGKRPIVREVVFGTGLVYMVREDTNLDEWKELAQQIIYKC
jgi:hypothetical protein